MRIKQVGIVACAAIFFAYAAPASAQDPQTDVTPTDTAPSDTVPAETTNGGEPSAPTSVEPGSTELPPVEVIQTEPEPGPTVAQQQPEQQPVSPAPAAPAEAPAQPAAEPVAGTGGIDSGTVLMSPVQGSAIPIKNYPGAVGRASASDIARSADASIPEVLQNTVPGVIIGDGQGNVFRRNLQYRGFEASPINGVAQGIAVYQNGVRINEAFGDVVNWDFLPDNAIDGITIVGANPVYGLNAIGGAVAVVMRDGFNFHGFEIDTRFGSFGRKQVGVAAGAQSGIWGAFISGEYIDDDGFRDFSEAEIRRMYADIGVKHDGVELHLNYTGADNLVGVTAAAPVQLLNLGWNRTFTSPQTSDNNLNMLSLNGSVEHSKTLTFSGVGYYRWYKQRNEDGNILEAEDCGGGPGPAGTLCLEEDGELEPAEGIDGNTIPFSDELAYGSNDRTTQDAESYGGAVQAVEKTPLWGHPNQFLIGASYDHGRVDYTTSSELGFFRPKFVVTSFDPPIFLAEPDDFAPRDLTTTNEYIGLYFSDTMEVTSDLAVTVGGRWNYARIKLEDNTGDNPQLNGDHQYYRFNPMAGATYQVHPGVTMFGSYAEANRAPTPAELACADPEEPCLIESFLTADPPLDQVVSRTYEFGFRGQMASLGQDQRLEWTAGLFRTETQDDIIAVAAPTSGRGFFQNAGDTLRQGIEAGITYRDSRWFMWANYAFIDATFQSDIVIPSPNNPDATGCPPPADDETCVFVTPGDRLPGIPQHRFKTGFDYWVHPHWKVGADLVAVSDQIFFGDESNVNQPLAGYARVDLRTSYDVTEHVQLYGLIDNVFDSRYGLFGNFFDLDGANDAAEADPSTGAGFFTNPRTITPAPPFAIYGGMRVKY